jgi:hypothetical protein
MSGQYFAKLDENNVVLDVAVVERAFLESNPERYSGNWVETFFNTDGKTYAGIGFIYNEESDDFVAPEVVEP